ncbi:MAG: 30S ribosomal protein S1 [Actinomycetota bacterium]|nr:30S ribosomal protein S1 [Actinomycetota bacterium]MCL6093653.1 30S ribosomal protein S1 [Actinomycetota bacterium]MDA8166791.1 30S ribosomal protein S1 [Actinomycetota bacterium]
MQKPNEEEITIVEGSGGLLKLVDGKEEPNYDITINIFQEGDIVTGEVVRVDKDEILVDIGYKSEGVIPASELSIRKSVSTDEEVSIGDRIDALVMQKEDAEGRLILSKKRARFEQAWKRIEEVEREGSVIEGTVIEVVKGGLILDLGVRGFLPASLVDIRRIQNLDEYMGKVLQCKVIELNRNRNNVVLSRRAVLEEERKEVREQILDKLQPGDVVKGIISNIVDFGAFVDLEGIDGLIHISELSWGHVNHPSEVLTIGQEVSVKVLDIDRDRQRVSLGLKQTQEDPWKNLVDTHQVGDVISGAVTKLVSFGAFVQISEGIEGLVHISELANHHVEKPEEIVAVGDEIEVKIIEIDGDRRRLSLSMKRLQEDSGEETAVAEEESGEAEAAEPVDEAEAAVEAAEPEPAEETDAEVPSLGLSDEVFTEEVPSAAVAEAGEETEAAAEETRSSTDLSLAEEVTPEADAAAGDAEKDGGEAEAEKEKDGGEAEAEKEKDGGEAEDK